MTQHVSIEEYDSVRLVELEPDDLVTLAASPALTVTPSLGAANRYDLRAGHHVGLVAGPAMHVRIRPKVPVNRVLFLAAYALDQSGWGPAGPSFAPSDDLVAGAATAMVTLAEHALAQGVLQGYRTVEEALPMVLGRIVTAAQARRRFGLPLPVEVRYDEFTPDIDENRVVRTALGVVERLPLVPRATVRRARHLAGRLDGVGELIRGSAVPVIPMTRLNRRYESALTLSRLILRATSFDLPLGSAPGVQFLFDMNRVFEDFLSATLTRALEARHGGRVVPQRVEAFDVAGEFIVKPDLTWLGTAGRPRAVIDAKYKSLTVADLPNADVYQALAYARCLGLAEAHLVYAAGNERPSSHVLRPGDVTVHVHTLDLEAAPAELLATVDSLARRISRATELAA